MTATIFDEKSCEDHDRIELIGGYMLCVRCGDCQEPEDVPRIPVKPIHHYLLKELREIYPEHYTKNRTAFFYSQMWQYKYEKKVWRCTVMGETRGGKSETAFTTAMNNIRIFNTLLERGHYKDMQVDKSLKFKKISLTVDHVYANESEYHYALTDQQRTGKLCFGTNHVIDEKDETIGGMGSFTEEREMLSRNNIIAKFAQDETWVTPRKFLLQNTPYGLHAFIKDEKNKINWCLLYKLQMTSDGIREQNFLGWVGIKLHDDKRFRKAYEKKKDEWIKKEIEGKTSRRAIRRQEATEYLANDPGFNQHTYNKNGDIIFKKNIESMKFLVERAMIAGEIDKFNEAEIERIVHGARALIEERAKRNDT